MVYAYSQHTPESVANLKYFLRFGVRESREVQFVFVVNGCHSISFPDFVRVIERENACFDFGAWGIGIGGEEADFVIVMNGSVRGPFLPSFETREWWQVFTDQATDGDLVGTSLSCLKDHSHLQSMFLAFSMSTYRETLRPFFEECYDSKDSAIYNAELAVSRTIVEKGGKLKSQLLATDCERIRENSALGLGDVYFPSSEYAEADVRPLEVVFFKTARSGTRRKDLERLTDWAYWRDGLEDRDERRLDYYLKDARGVCGAIDHRAVVSVAEVAARPYDHSRTTQASNEAYARALEDANAEILSLRRELAVLKSSCVLV